jgi:hypothetical protein
MNNISVMLFLLHASIQLRHYTTYMPESFYTLNLCDDRTHFHSDINYLLLTID